ncbi:magnesium/cobalt transporter CorA [Nocardioides sp.]|uniref:magnesium/cobalt transporter CorA n=1 Tax=Nocardioides sp. TaxID=35761 RepID=UPI002D03FEC8|nr:magnesium/cobalt transporter CorA [Nocardioides sp.]HSX67825.1 magnesium/cobalt transporter CorA [Nocardioides sp.]
MIVDSALYRDGVRVPLDCTIDDLSRLRAECDETNEFVWIGLHEPTEAELERVAAIFNLHPLAVEDALMAHQRPKLERYPDSTFLVLKTLWYVDETDAVETGEINVFTGRDFVVTVRHGKGAELHTARLMLEQRAAVLSHGPSAVSYAVCDRVVDEYLKVAGELEIDVDEVEASVFSEEETDETERIYILKRELAEVRRAVLPLREPMNRAATGAVAGMPMDAAPYFRDVADHLGRVAEAIDTLDSLLSSAFEAQTARISLQLSKVSAQQNEDMRKISAGAALVLVPTLIAGIYGMNFDHMPELHWFFGYPFALVLMAGVSLYLYLRFKRSGWL